MTFKEYLFIIVFIILNSAVWSQQNTIINGVEATRLDAFLKEAVQKGFHGNVLVTQKGVTILQQGYGFANEETKTPFTPGTFIQIGSAVKDFTKTALLQLLESKKIALTDPLSNFITGLNEQAQKISIRHLVNHTAGLPIGIKGDRQPLTADEMISTLRNMQLSSEPGTKENYSNLGYSLIAYIIEKVSGKTFDRYVYDHILKPLAMLETGTYIPNFDRKNIARGYIGSEDKGMILDMPHDDNGHLWSLRGNGGYLSTLKDMMTFYKSFSTDKLIKNPAFRNLVYNSQAPVFLAGSDMISFFVFRNIPELNLKMIIASNHSGYKGDKIMGEINPILGIKESGGRKITTAGTGDETGNIQQPKKMQPDLTSLPLETFGKTIRNYIEAFNTGDVDKMKTYFQQYAETGANAAPLERRLNNYKMMWEALGKITFQSYNQGSSGSWAVKFLTEKDGMIDFTFIIGEEKPYYFKAVRFQKD